MKEFSLELAKQGHPVCTRDGRNARIIFWEAKGDFPIIALITLSDGSEEHISYTINGEFSMVKQDVLDLMLATTKHEGWVNVYKNNSLDIYETDGFVYETKEIALEEKHDYDIATIKIEWEE